MVLTDAQKATLKAALLAETDPSITQAITDRNDVAIAAWCNGASTQDAWKAAARKRELFAVTDLSKFAALTAGNREAWRLAIECADSAPMDIGPAKVRKDITDIWGTSADGQAVLLGLIEKATRAEQYLGGTARTSAAITAWQRNVVGTITVNEVSAVLNG